MRQSREGGASNRCGMNQDADPIQQSIVALEEVEKLISPSFGPNKQAVLIHRPAGQVVLTSCGMEILKCVSSEWDPVVKVVLDGACKVESSIGDGSKTFIFVLLDLLRNCSRLHERSKVASQLLLLQARLVSDFDAVLRNKSHQVGLESSDMLQMCRNILETFFATRFPQVVNSTLVDLMVRLIQEHMCESAEFWWADMKMFLANFHILSLQVTLQSISDSHVLPGFLVTRQLAIDLEQSIGVKMIIWKGRYGTDRCDSKDEKVILQVDSEKTLDTAIAEDSFLYSAFLDKLVEQGVTLVMTPLVLSDLVVFLCRKRGLGLLHGVPLEEVDHVCQVTNLLPVVDFREDIEGGNITVIPGVRTCVLGTHCFTLLSIPHVRHLVVCGPTRELCGQYYSACKQSLKLLQQWVVTTSEGKLTGLSVPAGGYAEHQLNQLLLNKNLFGDMSSQVVNAVADSLLSVPRRLYGRREFLFRQLSASKADSLKTWGNTGVEPTRAHLTILCHMLETCAAIVRVTGIHRIKSEVKKCSIRYKCNSSSEDEDDT